jgi:hypothetical protein
MPATRVLHVLLMLTLFASPLSAAENPPNIMLVFIDDMGW